MGVEETAGADDVRRHGHDGARLPGTSARDDVEPEATAVLGVAEDSILSSHEGGCRRRDRHRIDQEPPRAPYGLADAGSRFVEDWHGPSTPIVSRASSRAATCRS